MSELVFGVPGDLNEPLDALLHGPCQSYRIPDTLGNLILAVDLVGVASCWVTSSLPLWPLVIRAARDSRGECSFELGSMRYIAGQVPLSSWPQSRYDPKCVGPSILMTCLIFDKHSPWSSLDLPF